MSTQIQFEVNDGPRGNQKACLRDHNPRPIGNGVQKPPVEARVVAPARGIPFCQRACFGVDQPREAHVMDQPDICESKAMRKSAVPTPQESERVERTISQSQYSTVLDAVIAVAIAPTKTATGLWRAARARNTTLRIDSTTFMTAAKSLNYQSCAQRSEGEGLTLCRGESVLALIRRPTVDQIGFGIQHIGLPKPEQIAAWEGARAVCAGGVTGQLSRTVRPRDSRG